jgi:hypothetical protein
MIVKKFIVLSFAWALAITLMAQEETLDPKTENKILDSLYIEEFQEKHPPKVLHAEPLYIDLIRDLGARKGEKEWNFGFGLTDNLKYDTYQALIEYEWAPVNRLGLEVELPVTIVAPYRNGESAGNGSDIPRSRIESLKTAMQWSFYVSEKRKTTLALGYINELEFSDLKEFGSPLFKGNIYNPFLIAAKRLNNNWHALLYTGPQMEHSFKTNSIHTQYEIHSNVHYMISGTRNFLGLEINKYVQKDSFSMTLRPQMRVGIAENFLIGIVGGIPISRENQRFSMFTRIIWEPKH